MSLKPTYLQLFKFFKLRDHNELPYGASKNDQLHYMFY